MTKNDLELARELLRALRREDFSSREQDRALFRVIRAAAKVGTMDKALHDMTGAADALRTQVEQMRGMFDDDDGTIADACEAHDEALQSLKHAREGK